ncbi:MAG: DUF2231 domain-containing protein [Parvibaculaceae bacterium]|jgi:uncharacterized membrane protein
MDHPHSPPAAAAIGGQPIHSMLVQFPVVCFTLALVTDLAYWSTEDLMWHHFSSWLLFAGLVFGGLAAIAGIIDFLFRRDLRAHRPAWPHALGSLIVLLLALANSFVHAGDGWTAIVPWGIVLSAATVVVMIVSDWFGRALVFRYGVGVRDDG